MSRFSDFYNTIDDITAHLRTDLIGPVEERETLEIEEPLSRYSLGILWAQPDARTEEAQRIQEEMELFDDGSEDSEEPAKLSVFKPSSMGLSFSAESGDQLEIRFSYGVYLHAAAEVTEDGKTFNQHSFTREPRCVTASVTVPGRLCEQSVPVSGTDVSLHLHVRRVNADGSCLVTVSALNDHKSDEGFIESSVNALFQCRLSIQSRNGFRPVYQRALRCSAEEEKNNMLYDDVHNYACGHGCAAAFSGDVLCSEFLPQYRMLQMMPRLFSGMECLSMQFWGVAERSEACRQLLRLIAEYEAWYSALQNQKELIGKYPAAARTSLENIRRCIQRLHAGVELLRRDETAWQAFRFMNEAMLLQRIKTKHCAPESVSWYPFQLAYILQIIPDIADRRSPFRESVDLLWFPTGGGKTEAYLGLSAFSIFYRRLRRIGNVDGVAIIMRYTLRLLTIQQFERATALVCACEDMRRRYGIPGGEISIGLWIGAAMTPNHIEDAAASLEKLRNETAIPLHEANPMQVTRCPWCGAEIRAEGYSIEGHRMNIRCHANPDCVFHRHLPIYVVDDDIYQQVPTFVLSTVDKFARITWEENAGNLFGAAGHQPPELIIQDELHLISGPLGSITGIYEIAVDEICKHFGGSPKIIASTATVRNADDQIRILYDRNMIQFPPNGLSQKDSFFAVEADENSRPARTYLGICAIGSGTSEMLIKIFALLTFLKHLYRLQNKPTDVIDQFYTHVGYFNSLKELGSNAIIISDRIFAEIRYLATYKFRAEAERAGLRVDGKDSTIPLYLKNDELTSRNSAKEIKTVLERLEHPFTDDNCFDYIMASNMLSVGIDIGRLGVMCMYGQPKSNAEYIQATSRVGRTHPGLVLSLYNGMRSRDKSHYEQFQYYHSTFYKYVESTSVTSYSARAIEKALHCALVAIIRHTLPRYRSNSSARLFKRHDPEILRIEAQIRERVEFIAPRMADYAEEWMDYYLDCWETLAKDLPNRLVYADYHNEDVALLRSGENSTGSDLPTVLNSVRNVEASSNIYFTKR